MKRTGYKTGNKHDMGNGGSGDTVYRSTISGGSTRCGYRKSTDTIENMVGEKREKEGSSNNGAHGGRE